MKTRRPEHRQYFVDEKRWKKREKEKPKPILRSVLDNLMLVENHIKINR